MEKNNVKKIILFIFFIMTVTLSLFGSNQIAYAKTVTLNPVNYTYYNRGSKGWGWDTYTAPDDVKIYNYDGVRAAPTSSQYIHKLNTYGNLADVGSTNIEELWYYAVQNNSTEIMDVDIYAVRSSKYR